MIPSSVKDFNDWYNLLDSGEPALTPPLITS